ncbi:MAG TPA: sugar dehydrogenase complex small subunit, partial [Steroidobacteraceae bacterium]|nr:sugar dehydrogenase complex small subunit [Steroidobacteraceae bacterium]
MAPENLDHVAASRDAPIDPSRRRLLAGLLTTYTASLIPWALALAAPDADRGAFTALSAILVGRQVLDTALANRIYDALVAANPHFPTDVQALLTLINERHIDPQ